MWSMEEIKNMKYPYELFTDDIDEIKNRYVELMRVYHPELNDNKEEYIEIIQKINQLYTEAEESINSGEWNKPGFIKLKLIDGKYYTISFRISHNFELGKMYIGDNTILYLLDEENEKLALNAIKKIESLKYVNEDMKKEFYKCFPKVSESFKTIKGKIGIVIEKDEDLILLKDLLSYSNGKLLASTVNWILNSLYNIVCFIHFNGLTHNGISIENYFISTKNQYGALLGGWWYSVDEGKELIGISKDIFNIMQYEMKEIKNSNTRLDLESIKLLGRTLLGDKSGILLTTDSNIPRNLSIWLRENTTGNSFEEYSVWSNISNYFGERNVVKTSIDKDELYRKLGGN